ncbi:MAG: bacterial transcriptional activator domain-containing protein, partial [Desulfobacteraceae bacterium]
EETLSRVFALGSLTDLYYSVHFDLDWFSPFAERFLKNNPDLDHLWAPARSLVKSKQPGDKQKAPTRFSVNGSQSDKDLLDLHVYSLGPFRIFANGREVALGECQSKKALKLLKYLFFRRHESGIILDEALELLWPGMNPEVTRPNLRVILSMLRKVFKNPKIGENGFPNLMREGNRLILSLGRNGWADVDEFMGQIKLAEYKERRGLWSDALSHYKKTASLYYGDFISDEPYADWCSMEREYLRDQFLTALFRMADCQERLGDLSAAISTLYHLLKLDRYREDAYRRLMHLCFSAGRKGEIIRVYDLCRKNIEEDLGVNLSEDTLDLYRNLCGSSNRTVMTDLLGSTGTRGSTRTYVRL